MEQKLKCAVVRDLLPNYIEKLTSDETNLDIEEHLSGCEPCTKVYEEMKAEVPSDGVLTEAKNLSKFLRKTKVVSALKTCLMVMLILGIVVNVIVDLAVNQRITWSIFVIAYHPALLSSYGRFATVDGQTASLLIMSGY